MQSTRTKIPIYKQDLAWPKILLQYFNGYTAQHSWKVNKYDFTHGLGYVIEYTCGLRIKYLARSEWFSKFQVWHRRALLCQTWNFEKSMRLEKSKSPGKLHQRDSIVTQFEHDVWKIIVSGSVQCLVVGYNKMSKRKMWLKASSPDNWYSFWVQPNNFMGDTVLQQICTNHFHYHSKERP